MDRGSRSQYLSSNFRCRQTQRRSPQWSWQCDRLSLHALGAEQVLAAERGNEKIAIEIKSFLGESELFDYHAALGQFLNYKLALQLSDPDRTLFLAVPVQTWRSLFDREFPKKSVQEYQVKLIIYDSVNEVIVQWQN